MGLPPGLQGAPHTPGCSARGVGLCRARCPPWSHLVLSTQEEPGPLPGSRPTRSGAQSERISRPPSLPGAGPRPAPRRPLLSPVLPCASSAGGRPGPPLRPPLGQGAHVKMPGPDPDRPGWTGRDREPPGLRGSAPGARPLVPPGVNGGGFPPRAFAQRERRGT